MRIVLEGTMDPRDVLPVLLSEYAALCLSLLNDEELGDMVQYYFSKISELDCRFGTHPDDPALHWVFR